MLGITDTYWDEVNAILSSKDTFLNYMKQSNEYIYASDDERAQLLYQWEEAYDKWIKAQKNDANYDHSDSGLGSWNGSEYTGNSSGGGSSGGSGGSSSSNQTPSSGTTNPGGWSGTQYGENNYRVESVGGLGDSIVTYNDNLEAAKSLAKTYSSQHKNVKVSVYGPDGKLLYQYINGGQIAHGSAVTPSSSSMPDTGWPSYLSSTSNHGYYWKLTKDGKNIQGSLGGPKASRTEAQTLAAAAASKYPGSKYQTKYFMEGGIADFTGPAWLDGTKERPERILSAQQTEDFDELVSILDDLRNSGITMDLLRDMMNWSTMINVPSQLSYVGNDAYRGNIANIGDIHVTVQEAQINDDRDIDDLAEIVGQKFVKEISKQGFNIAHYNF